MPKLSPRELAHVLAALRMSQNHDVNGYGHFDAIDGGSLFPEEVDALCERINVEVEPEGAPALVEVARRFLEVLDTLDDGTGADGQDWEAEREEIRAAIAKAGGPLK